MSAPRHGERRYRLVDHDPHIMCRLCWKVTTLALERIDVTEDMAFHTCPNCGGAFPIRRADIAWIPLGEGVPAQPPQQLS